MKRINKKYIYSILSFTISSSLMILIFLFNQMNGVDYLVIRSDYIDSIGFYKDFSRSIISHDSIFFNYSSGLGLNNIMVVSGLFSPFNLLYLVFHKVNFDFLTAIIIILRVGFAALSFQLFSQHTIKNDKIFSVFVSVFYSLSAYTIEYCTIQISWLDALIILPILISSIVDCIENRKRVNLILLYFYIFVSNFYMGYVIGVFTLIFVIFYMIILYQTKTKNKIQEYISKVLNWFFGVVIAAMLSAFVWVPALFFLAANRVPDSTEITELNVSLLQILNSLFWGMGYDIEGTYAYIYCGVPILIYAVLFFINRNISQKMKWFYGILISILALSMVSNRLNTIWHVFDQPDDFWYRYSFLFSFCLCTIASISLLYFDFKNGSKFIYITLGLVLFYQLMLHTSSLWKVDQGYLNSNYGFVINLVLIILWCTLSYFGICKNKYGILCFILALATMSFELITGSKRMITDRTEASQYNAWVQSVEKTANEITEKDSDFFRTIFTSVNNNYNADTYFGLKGIGDFGNQEKYGVRTFLSNIGFASSPRITCENGYSPVSEMLLGVKYEIDAPEVAYREHSTKLGEVLEDFTEENDTNKMSDNISGQETVTTYSVNPYALKIGFLVDGDLLLYKYNGRNVFRNMNEMVSAMSGLDDPCFVQVPMDNISFNSTDIILSELDTGEFLFVRDAAEGQMEITIPKEVHKKAYIQFEKEETGLYGIDYFVLDAQNAPNVVANRLATSSAIEMNTSEEGDCFITTIGSFIDYSPEHFLCEAINVAYLDEEALKKQYNELCKNQLEIIDYKNGHIEGNIHIEGDKRMLFTTIPYDPGWRAFINGQEVEPIRVIDGTFMAVLLPKEGDYNIVFDFECPGLKIGVIVSICGIFALLSVIFERKLRKNKK